MRPVLEAGARAPILTGRSPGRAERAGLKAPPWAAPLELDQHQPDRHAGADRDREPELAAGG
jgi:hypothetical protein